MQQHRQRFAKDMTRGFNTEELEEMKAQLERLLANVSEP
jgi:hypothetical protein